MSPLGLAWAAAVVVAVGGASAHPRRLPPTARSRPARVGFASIGRLVRWLGRRGSPEADRRRGVIVVVGGAIALVEPLLVPVVPVVGAVAGRVARRRTERRHQRAVWAESPEVTEMLALAVAAGATPHAAVRLVGELLDGPVARALRAALAQAEMGERLADRLEEVAQLDAAMVQPFVDVLLAAERYGSPMGPGLLRCRDELRGLRRRRAEEEARRIPVRLLFPLVGCVLPAFVLLTFVPLLAGSLSTFDLGP